MVKFCHALGGGWFIHERRYFVNPTAAFGAHLGSTYRAAKESLPGRGVMPSTSARGGRFKVAFWLCTFQACLGSSHSETVTAERETLRNSFSSCVGIYNPRKQRTRALTPALVSFSPKSDSAQRFAVSASGSKRRGEKTVEL